MPFALSTITFNHDMFSANTSSMNIRRNKDFEVPVPEYDSSIPRTPAESCAAYTMRETQGQNVFVRANFTLAPATGGIFEVRATGGGVLGALDPQTVMFVPGAGTQTADFPLAHRDFSRITQQDITWQWQYRLGKGAWLNMVATQHHIYVVLKVPPAPWTQTPSDKRNPWTDLLDVCCATAAGTQTQAAATEKIIKQVHLGYNLRYDIQFGADRYGFSTSGTSFDLTDWIDFVLRGNAPANPVFCGGTAQQYKNFLIVNCYDCAASSALMAKVLGADSDYFFHAPFGYLNYVLPIGRGKCNNPFPGCTGNNPAVGPDDPRTDFGNHAYTKLGGSQNYDACMRQWVSPLTALVLILLWLIILIITLGLLNLTSLLNRAGGWLIDLSQTDYNTIVVDTSQPFELVADGGSPALQTLQFRVV
jgi:hypothetical protein